MSSPPSAARLEATGLAVERGGRMVLSGVGFTVSAGEALLLTGPNGSGKTTLLRAIAGFLPLSAGHIRLGGADPEATVGEQCHVIGHANAIKGALTVVENLAFWSAFLGNGKGAPAAVAGALARLDLEPLADVPTVYLSAGQRRRTALARLLVAPRLIWLLDEPSVSLDAASTAMLAGLVAEHVAAGGMAIAATHVPLGIPTARELKLSPTRPATAPAEAHP